MNKERIQETSNYLADLCLKDAGNYNNYTDKNLLDATLIFSNVLMDVIYTSNRHLSKEKQMELAKMVGERLRDLIYASTGKDMHVLAKQ